MQIFWAGDSHSYRARPIMYASDPLPFKLRVRSIQRASAQGLGSGSKTTGAEGIIRETHASLPTSPEVAVFAFGQIDIEKIYWYKRVVENMEQPFEDYCDMVIDKYLSWIDANRELAPKILIKGPNQTVMERFNRAATYVADQCKIRNRDLPDGGPHMVRLREIYADYDERLQMTFTFNDKLRDKATEMGLIYFDINAEICDDKGRVRDAFSTATEDHHLVPSRLVAKIHFRKLVQAAGIEVEIV